jgi:hypothetical protein
VLPPVRISHGCVDKSSMIRRIRQPKYRDRGRSFDLLKIRWKLLGPDELWPLLRSITIREHLHTTGYFGRNFASSRVVDSSYLLRRRRREIRTATAQAGVRSQRRVVQAFIAQET